MANQIVKSLAKLIDYPQSWPIAPIQDNEKCCLCDLKIPVESSVLRHMGTKKILCVLCVVGVSEELVRNSTRL